MHIIEFLQLHFVFRMLIASVCGVFIGLERKNRAKEAGVRTHCLVACGAALMMILSKYSFFDLPADFAGVRGADPARIAAQVVSGIGFLGAGMIFVHKNTITGLTTAAGIWATAGIGMAFGSGMYPVGFAATIIVLIIQIVLHKSNNLTGAHKLVLFSLHSDGEPDFQKRLYNELEALGINIYSTDVLNDTDNNRFNYMLTIELPPSINEESIVAKYDHSRITPVN